MKLGEVAVFFSGGTPSTYNKTFYKGDIPFIRSGEIHDSRTELAVSKEAVEGSSAKIVFVGDILLALYGATSGDIAISKMRGAINQAILCIRPSSEIDREFLFFTWEYQRTDIVRKYIQGGQGNLSAEIVKNLPLRLPSLTEQRKITALLSLIDERIEVQNAIIKEREAQKATLLRRLFDRTLRFPEFTDEWTQTTIGEICKVSTGEMNTQDKIEDGMYPFYVRSSKIERANRYTYDGVAILTPGDGAIGQIFHYSKGKIAVHQRVYMLTEMQCIPKYLFHCFSARFFGRVNRMSAKNTVDSVRMNMITDMPIPLPSLPEQRKIAALLSAIDERLDVERAYAEQLKQQKAYLLRQMFI